MSSLLPTFNVTYLNFSFSNKLIQAFGIQYIAYIPSIGWRLGPWRGSLLAATVCISSDNGHQYLSIAPAMLHCHHTTQPYRAYLYLYTLHFSL